MEAASVYAISSLLAMYIRPRSTETPAIPPIAIKLAAVAIKAIPRSPRFRGTFSPVMMFSLDQESITAPRMRIEGTTKNRGEETAY